MAKTGWHVWMVEATTNPRAKIAGVIGYKGCFESVGDIAFSYSNVGGSCSTVENPDVVVGPEHRLFEELVRDALQGGIIQRGFTIAIWGKMKTEALRQMQRVFTPIGHYTGENPSDRGITARRWSYTA